MNYVSLESQCPPRLRLLRFSGNKIHCSPRDQSLTVKYGASICNTAKQKATPKTIFFSAMSYLPTYLNSSLVPRSVVIDQEYTNLTLVTGDAVHLNCVPDGDIPFKVVWRKEGKQLTPQANDSLLLHIRSRKDGGRYECVATGKQGEEVLAIDVIVFGELITNLHLILRCLGKRFLYRSILKLLAANEMILPHWGKQNNDLVKLY